MSVFNRQKDLSVVAVGNAGPGIVVKVPAAAGRQSLIARISGTFVGTVKIQTSDDGKTWADATVVKMSDGTAANPTVPGLYCALLGAASIAGRVIFSAYTSGTMRVEAAVVPHQA